MVRNVIDDGYTKPGFIAPEDRLHQGLSFEYRPMLPEEADAVDEVIVKQPAQESHKVIRAALRNHLVSWDEKDKSGKALSIELDHVRRLPPRLFNKLYRIVSGQIASDDLPDASPDQERDYVQALLESAGTDKSPGQVADEADQKNSSAG